MNGPEHHAIVKLGLESLPAWAAAHWTPLLPDALGTCMLPDQKAIALLRGETGPWRRYFPRRAWKLHFDGPQADWRTFLPDTRFYLRNVVASLKAGDMQEAARFAGVYSHWIGDFSQPAHHYDLEIATLLPPPPSMRNCEYHRMIEDIPSSIQSMHYRARVLGRTQAECLFRLAGRYETLFRDSVAALIPMTQAIYRRRHAPAVKLLDKLVRDSAALFADFCCTAQALADGRVPAADRRRLAVCDLWTLAPDAYDVEFNFGHKPLRDWITIESYGRALPLALFQRDRANRLAAVKVPGLCTIPHALPLETVEPEAWLEYRLPSGVFERFVCEVGLLAGTERRQAPSCFEVLLDGRSVARSPELGAGDEAARLEADIRGARTLRLRVRTDGSTDKLAYAVWGRPRLFSTAVHQEEARHAVEG